MKARRTLRLISFVMPLVAVIVVLCALSNPTLRKVFYIGGIKIGSDITRVFYKVYVIIMAALFCISFFVKDKK